MKKEELLALGLTEEQAAKVLEENGKDVGKAINKAKEGSIDPKELKRLQDNDAAYQKLVDADLTDAEKVQKALKEAENTKIEFAKKTSRLEVEKLFVAAGLTEDEYKDVIDNFVTEDAEKSKVAATAFTTLVTKQKETAVQKTKEELMNNTDKPGGNGGEDENNNDTSDGAKYAQQYCQQYNLNSENGGNK